MRYKNITILTLLPAIISLIACKNTPSTPYIGVTLIPSETSIVTTQTTVAEPASNCVTIVEQSLPSPSVQGKIVLTSLPPFTSPSYLVNLSSGETTVLPQMENKFIVDSSFSVSPNGEWLEYAQINSDPARPTNETLHILSSDGKEHNVISTDLDFRTFFWLDNNYLLIENLKEDWISSSGARANLLLLNPFNGEKRDIFNDFPNLFVVDNVAWEFSLSRAIYNAALTHVIHPTVVEYVPVIRLIDVQTGEIITDIQTTDFGKFPAWSPNGELLAFATQTDKTITSDKDEIFIITKDGELKQLTNLSKANDYSYITGLSWSIDNRHIAFWVNNTDQAKGRLGTHLAILDISTGDVRDYCDMGNSKNVLYIPEWDNPIWSLDGKYLVLNLQDISNDPHIFDSDKHVFVVLVETTTRNAFQVAENYQAVGWLK